MLVLQYPAVLEKDDNDTWLVTFPDFDDAVTFGETQRDCADSCGGCIRGCHHLRMTHKRDIPAPSPRRGRPLVSIPPLTAAKALLYQELPRRRSLSVSSLRSFAANIRWHIGFSTCPARRRWTKSPKRFRRSASG